MVSIPEVTATNIAGVTSSASLVAAVALAVTVTIPAVTATNTL